jgi:hypothetical protein
VAQELDQLRGAFRKKENELLAPIINKYSLIETNIERLTQTVERLDFKV